MKELLFSVTKDDLEISFFSGTGAGGQHRNKHQNCVRMRHPDSGTATQCSEHRSKDQNLRTAFQRLVDDKKFKAWSRKKAAEMMITKEQREKQKLESEKPVVDCTIRPDNIKIEVKDEAGNWIEAEKEMYANL